MDFLLFKLTMVPIEYAGLVLVLLGVILFAFKPVLAIDAAAETAAEKKTEGLKGEAYSTPRTDTSSLSTPSTTASSTRASTRSSTRRPSFSETESARNSVV